jgi:hypothetical protein
MTTPGPWHWTEWHLQGADDLVLTASENPPTLSDARLIAAAPDLYALLAEARLWMDGDLNNDPWETSFCEKIDAVLKKARGV